MASTAITVLSIIASIIYVNAMAIKKIPEDSSSSIDDHQEISADVPQLIIFGIPKFVFVDEDQEKIRRSALVEKRSIEENNVKAVSSNGIAEDNDNDLETAAGTNILRPLFVYRQQLAYRERVRKARRGAAPDFGNRS